MTFSFGQSILNFFLFDGIIHFFYAEDTQNGIFLFKFISSHRFDESILWSQFEVLILLVHKTIHTNKVLISFMCIVSL